MTLAFTFAVYSFTHLGQTVPAWAIMWSLAFAIYAASKWAAYVRARRQGVSLSTARKCFYLLLWPGMDARPFANPQPACDPPGSREWIAASAKLATGVLALAAMGSVRNVAGEYAACWCGMAGVILVLHFGTFQLLALAIRRHGIDVQPIMSRPLAAKSLSDFWSGRWNLAFRDLSHWFVFAPLIRRRFGAGAAMFACFLVSGLVHDVLLSFPAHSGYGLPTLYFLIQASAILIEKSRPGRGIGLGRGGLGRIWTIAITALPAALLFHPAFVTQVAAPFFEAMGTMHRTTAAPSLSKLIALGGGLQLLILVASALVPRVLDWRNELAPLSPFVRRLFWVYGVFIVMTIIGFAALSLAFPGPLADGSPLSRAVCAFVAVFWLTRLCVQLFVFDARPILRNTILWTGYHGLTVIFLLLSGIYGLAALT